MQLGYFTMPLHPPGRNYLETLKEDREAIILADKLGFVEAYVGEHTTDLAETIPSCLMFLASLVHATHKIKLCTGTLNLPNGHPAAFAANVAMLEHMLEGRLIVGISPGGLPSDMEMFENLDRATEFLSAKGQNIIFLERGGVISISRRSRNHSSHWLIQLHEDVGFPTSREWREDDRVFCPSNILAVKLAA